MAEKSNTIAARGPVDALCSRHFYWESNRRWPALYSSLLVNREEKIVLHLTKPGIQFSITEQLSLEFDPVSQI